MAGHIATAKTVEWFTPDSILGRVRKVFGGAIDLDPCTTAENPTKARHTLTKEQDGLLCDWTECENVFCNPPYGKGLGRWVQKAWLTGQHREVILLAPASVDTRYWQEFIRQAEAICFLRGRVKFVGAAASAPMPVALAYWGGRPWNFEAAFFDAGWTVRP